MLAILAIVIGSILGATPADAQVTGTVQGYISDDSGARLPGVTVTVRNEATGIERSVFTNESGYFTASALQPNVYSITAALEGMQSVRREGVKVLVGQTVAVDLSLAVGNVEEAITVTAEAPVVETARSSSASYVSQEEIAALPIAGRDFKEFAFLTPTVQNDPERGFITMSGQRGIYSGLNIDGTSGKSAFFGYGRGGEATENDGLVIAQDSVKEFQVVTSGFAPEYGQNGGGYINVVTKSGSNNLSGTAFFFTRDDGMAEDIPGSPLDAARGNDGSQPVDEFSRDNWGLSIGGPIAKDRTHFFFSYDQTERSLPFSRQLDIPGLYDAVVARGPDFAALVRGFSPNADGTAQGLFLDDVENTILFGKVDHQFNESHTGTFRINATDFEKISDAPGEEALKAEDTLSLVASLVSIIGDDKINEVRLQLAEDNLDRISDLDDAPVAGELEFSIDGRRNTIGKDFFLPIFVTEEKTQFQNNFSYLFNDHDFKFGVDYQKDDLSQLFAGFRDGRFRFSSLEDFNNDFATFELIFYGPPTNPNYDEAQELLSFYAQDQWRPNEKLTINYGFRWGQTDNPDGLEHVFAEGRNIADDNDNFAPRFGFTYTPNGKDVIRGGAGLFYGRTPSLIFAGPVVQNGLFPNFGIVFTLFFQPGFQPFGTPIDNLNPPEGVANEPNLVAGDFEDPETLRFNFGYERDLGNNWSAGIDLVYAEGDKLQESIDRNLLNPTYDEFGRPIFSDERPDSNFGEIFTRTSIGESEYTAITIKAGKRFSDRYQLNAHYTWSEDMDTSSNERSATGIDVSDPTNLRYDWGPSNRNVENRFVLSGLVILPWDIKLSGILEFRDGTPWTATDNNLLEDDYCPHSNCPDILGVINGQRVTRNSFENDSIERVDIRLSKFFDFGSWDIDLFAEVFNALDENTFFVNGNERQVTTGDGLSGNPEFGIPDNLITTPRQFQIGARVSFK